MTTISVTVILFTLPHTVPPRISRGHGQLTPLHCMLESHFMFECEDTAPVSVAISRSPWTAVCRCQRHSLHRDPPPDLRLLDQRLVLQRRPIRHHDQRRVLQHLHRVHDQRHPLRRRPHRVPLLHRPLHDRHLIQPLRRRLLRSRAMHQRLQLRRNHLLQHQVPRRAIPPLIQPHSQLNILPQHQRVIPLCRQRRNLLPLPHVQMTWLSSQQSSR
mmetsp:Transcript_52927/g.84362  ORF Transcript_52927/g.84362 Transcript_52927/m.84362 type:complete len:215 (-) Transcript_52927:835-1479(-)